jgi:hypothetical protein
MLRRRRPSAPSWTVRVPDTNRSNLPEKETLLRPRHGPSDPVSWTIHAFSVHTRTRGAEFEREDPAIWNGAEGIRQRRMVPKMIF